MDICCQGFCIQVLGFERPYDFSPAGRVMCALETDGVGDVRARFR